MELIRRGRHRLRTVPCCSHLAGLGHKWRTSGLRWHPATYFWESRIGHPILDREFSESRNFGRIKAVCTDHALQIDRSRSSFSPRFLERSLCVSLLAEIFPYNAVRAFPFEPAKTLRPEKDNGRSKRRTSKGK